jgi:transglutaminase/protease-like cytokinesis protein 3
MSKQLTVTSPSHYGKHLDIALVLYSGAQAGINGEDIVSLLNKSLDISNNQILIKKVTICQGYAELFSALCNAAGIKNEIIIGEAKVSANNFGSHAWNAVCIDKKWYLIDVTWGERYYLKSPKYFFHDHFPLINRWTLLPEFHSFEEFK